jgi:hypothetical protein
MLSVDGSNWTFYRDRFVFAAGAAQLDYLLETAALLSALTAAIMATLKQNAGQRAVERKGRVRGGKEKVVQQQTRL